MSDVKVGQIWRERDNRFVRDVEVMSATENLVGIRNIATGRLTVAKRSRFRGVSGGYELLKEVTHE